MKDTPWNAFKLFLHCLFNSHEDCLLSGGHNPEIGCFNCGYGDKLQE